MTGAPQAASRVIRLPLEAIELVDAPGSVGRDEQDACVAALHEQRVHLLPVDADVGERAPEVVGAALVVAQTHGLPEHHFGIERFPVLREAVARHLRRVDEQVADPDAAFQLDGVAVDDARDLRFGLAAWRAGACGGERERGDRYCFRHCPGPTSTNRAKSAHPGTTGDEPNERVSFWATAQIWAGFDGCRETASARNPHRARLGNALREVPGSGEERAETPRVGQAVGPRQSAPRFHAPAERRSGYHLRPERIETREARRFRGGRKVEGT